MSRELLTMALDALETKYSDYLYDGAGPAIAGAFEADIAALRAALAKPQASCEALQLALETERGAANLYAKQVAHWIGKYDDLLAQQLSTPPAQPAPAVPDDAALRERVKALEDALRGTVRELQACQSVIHLAGGFDPAYVSDAQVALKAARAALEATNG